MGTPPAGAFFLYPQVAKKSSGIPPYGHFPPKKYHTQTLKLGPVRGIPMFFMLIILNGKFHTPDKVMI